MNWILSFFKSLFGIGLDKAAEAVKQDKLEAEASQARVAKAQLASNAEVTKEEEQLKEAAKQPTRVPPPAAETNDSLPTNRKVGGDAFVNRFNRK